MAETTLDRIFQSLVAGENVCPLSSGAYSRAVRIGPRVVKFTGTHRDTRGLSASDAGDWHQYIRDVVTYQKRLEGLGVPVPSSGEAVAMALFDDYSGEVAVVLVNANAGTPVEEIFRDPGTDREALVAAARRLLEVILPVLAQPRGPDGHILIGIDVALANFACVRDRIQYVDFTPPRFHALPIGYRIEYPQPQHPRVFAEGLRRFYTSEGILAQWTSYVTRACPYARTMFLTVIDELIPRDLRDSLYTAYPALKLTRQSPPEAWEPVIQQAATCMELRSIACAVGSAQEHRQDTSAWLAELFSATSYYPEPVAGARFALLQQALWQRLRSTS